VRARLRIERAGGDLVLQVEVADAEPGPPAPPGAPWEQDVIEIYVAAEGLDAVAYGPRAFQILVPRIGEPLEVKHDRLPERTRIERTATPGGYRARVTVPLASLGGDGSVVAVDVHVADVDVHEEGAGGRKTKLAWHSRQDDAWRTPRNLARVALSP
jgi:hypothetical protein